MFLHDGIWYESKEEAYDLGSLAAVEVHGNIRHYEGLSKDVDKLPHYETLGTGSSALCVDTGDYYKYEKSTDTWYKL